MKHILNKILLASLMLATTFLFSCTEDAEITESFSFTVNGDDVTLTTIDGGLDLFERLIAQGREGEDQEMEVILLNTNTGSFTQADRDPNAGLLDTNYEMSYTDASGNYYFYSSLSENSFSISISDFGSDEGSLIAGTFSGTLTGSISNGPNAPDSVVITNGTFTVSRSDASLDNIW